MRAMLPRLRFLSSLAALMGLVPILQGCPCYQESLVLDDFEQDDSPDEWTVQRGAIDRVTTFHEGRHGLRLAPGTLATRDVAGSAVVAPQFLHATLRCDPATTLRVVLVGAEPAISADGGTASEAAMVTVDFTTDGDELYLGTEESFPWPGVDGVMDTLSLETIGGSCTLDELILLDTRYCD